MLLNSSGHGAHRMLTEQSTPPNTGELGDGGAVQGGPEPRSIIQDGTRGSATDH